MKKFCFIIIVIFITALSGCDKMGGNISSPQEFVKLMYQKLDEGEISYDDIYEDYFAGVSKQIIEKESFISEKETEFADILKEGISITNITSELENSYNNSISRINTTLQYTVNGTPTTKILKEYIIKINGKYKYMYRGILSQKPYTMLSTIESNKVHADTATVYTTAGGLEVDIIMSNANDINFSFGYESGPKIDITTENGIYSTTLSQASVLNSNETVTLSAVFDEASGTVQRIVVYNIYTLNEQGQPNETGDGEQYAVLAQ